MLLLLIGIAGFFLEPREVQAQVLEWLSQYFPVGTRMIFRENIQSIIEVRNSISFFGFIGLLWSSTLMFDAIHEAVNTAWGTRGKTRFLTGKLKSLFLIGILVLAATTSAFLTAQISLISHLNFLHALPHWVKWPLLLGQEALTYIGMLLPFFLSVIAFGLAYRLLPQAPTKIRDIWPAALAAAILWEISKRVFVWYMIVRANYSQVYGSISAVLILMLWAYVSSLILIWGAELAAGIWRTQRDMKK